MSRAGSWDRPAVGSLSFLGAWALLAWPWLSGRVTIPWDAKAHFYPQLQFLAQSLHRGESPFWTPYAFSGWPQVADPQSLLASPPFLALAALNPDPSFRAADGVLFALLALAGLAIIALFRDRGWSPAAGAIAALCFAFGASAAWRLQHVGQVMSLAYLPIALWCLDRALARRSVAAGAAAGLVAGFLALGRDQVSLLALLVLAAWVVDRWLDGPDAPARVRVSLASLSAGLAAGALVTVGPTILTALLSDISNRPSIDYASAARGSLHPALLLTAWVPNLFGADGPFPDYWGPPSPRWGAGDLVLARNMGVIYLGALPLALLVVGLLRGVLWAREIRVVTLAFALMLLYALGRATPVFPALFHVVPGVDLFRRPADACFLVGGLGALLVGYVAHRWLRGTLGPLRRGELSALVLVLAAPVIVGGVLAWTKGTFGTAAPALVTAVAWIAAAAAFVGWAGDRRSAAVALLALGLVAADLRMNNGPNESTGLVPETYDALRQGTADPLIAELKWRIAEGGDPLARVEIVGLGFHWPNATQVHRLHHVLGYNPLRLNLYAAATGAEDHVAVPEQRRFAPLFPSYRSSLADRLGLSFLASGVPIERIDPRLAPGDLVPLGRFGDAHLYANPRARPRAHFAGSSVAADFPEILRTGIWPTDGPGTVLLAQASPGGPASQGQARILSYRHDEIVAEVQADGPGHLVLNDPWHPWWFAEVDGVEAPLLRANVLFRAVAVPAGASQVRLTFRPLRGAALGLRARFGDGSSPRASPGN